MRSRGNKNNFTINRRNICRMRKRCKSLTSEPDARADSIVWGRGAPKSFVTIATGAPFYYEKLNFCETVAANFDLSEGCALSAHVQRVPQFSLTQRQICAAKYLLTYYIAFVEPKIISLPY